MNLYDYFISLGLKDSDLNRVTSLFFYIPYNSNTLLFKFNIFFPFSLNVSTLLKVKLLQLFNVSNLLIEVDLDSGVISLLAQGAMIGKIQSLTGVLHSQIDLVNVEYVRELVRSKPHQGFKQGCYYFLNQLNGHGYVGKSAKLVSRIRDHLNQGSTYDGDLQVIHRALRKYGFGAFLFTCFLLNSSSLLSDPKVLLILEQFLIDHLVNTSYNVQRSTDLTSVAGESHPSYNSGFPLYLYKVLADDWCISKGEYYTSVTYEDLEFIKVFPNISRAKEELGIPAPRMYRYLTYSDKPIKLDHGEYRDIYFISKTPWH